MLSKKFILTDGRLKSMPVKYKMDYMALSKFTKYIHNENCVLFAPVVAPIVPLVAALNATLEFLPSFQQVALKAALMVALTGRHQCHTHGRPQSRTHGIALISSFVLCTREVRPTMDLDQLSAKCGSAEASTAISDKSGFSVPAPLSLLAGVGRSSCGWRGSFSLTFGLEWSRRLSVG